MSICVKCNKSIKPASLATEVGDEKFHPTCISCVKCDRPLWGKGFKRNREKKLECDPPCEPVARRPPSARQERPPSVQNQYMQPPQQQFSNPQLFQQQQPPPQLQNVDSYRKQPSFADQSQNQMYRSPQSLGPKICKVCNENVQNRRFITYESGEIICQDCDNRLNVRPPRVNSAHMIVCSCCNSTLRGTKYFTEPNGDIVCENCDSTGPRCTHCRQLFRAHDSNTRRTLANGKAYHPQCFNCSVCKNLIQTKDFYQTEFREPMCLDCYEISKLPKCSSCNKHISGKYFMLDNKPIHSECFKCSNCGNLLSNEADGFYKNKANGQPLCSNCNIQLNGAKCAKCSKVIEKEGITFSDKDYHKHCFTCDSCGTELARMKKTLTDKSGEGRFCEPCHIQKFSPKCAKCNESIPPYMPSTQYEGKNFHRECFACSRCKTSLANKKFFKSGNLTICEHCN